MVLGGGRGIRFLGEFLRIYRIGTMLAAHDLARRVTLRQGC